MKKFSLFTTVFFAACFLSLIPVSDTVRATETDLSLWENVFSDEDLISSEDINLRTDNGYDYTFTLHGTDFRALYTYNSWRIYDSWKIMNPFDIMHVCTVLSDEHPVPSRDYQSYRTPSDMTYEWVQHNIAYLELPEDNHWRNDARNVDLDPRDQGRTFKEYYQDRTGREIDNSELLDKVMEELSNILFGD